MDATHILDNLTLTEEVSPDLQDALDSLVYDVVCQSASVINNAGPEAQLEFLRETLSDREIAKELGLPFLDAPLFDSYE